VPDAPVFADGSGQGWEGWPENLIAERGTVQWKTLVSGDITPSRGLTAGVARLRPGGALRLHRHAQAEIYLILEGTGVVTIEGEEREVGPGITVYIPGGAVHGIENRGSGEVRFAYILEADSFEDVEYVFDV
jgi:mannose-6-phosphate isomerase-like protein (cupin superfamily)